MALAPTLSDDIAAEPPLPYRWTMLAGVWLLYVAFAVAIASMAPLVYRLMADLGMHRGEMGTVLAAWQLTYIFCSVPCGGLLDRFGPRRVLLIGTMIFGVGFMLSSQVESLVAAIASDLEWAALTYDITDLATRHL